MVTSSTNATFKETEANRTKPVTTITLDLKNAADNQISNISISEVALSHYDTVTFGSQPYYPANSQFSIIIGNPFVAGDVKGDSKLDITDVALLISYLNGNAPSNFVEVAAKIAGDDDIDKDDVTALINLILIINKVRLK